MKMIVNRWEDIRDKIRSLDSDDGKTFVYIVCTDEISFHLLSDGEPKLDFNKLLELRIFNKNWEYRIIRSSIGEDNFKEREILDSDPMDETSFFDQWQYLDMDDTTYDSEINEIKTTGGGKYTLPVPYEKDLKICVRNYIDYDEESGQAYVTDWRLVGFGTGEVE